MQLNQVITTLGGGALVLGSVAAGAPIAAVAAVAFGVGALSGYLVTDAREGRRKHFDQEALQAQAQIIKTHAEQKRQVSAPTVGVITHRPFWQAQELEAVPASQFCPIQRKIVYKSLADTIDARYHGGTQCGGIGYYCLADGPRNFKDSVFGSAQIPTTARQPYEIVKDSYPFSQTWEEFSTECQAVVDYCGNR